LHFPKNVRVKVACALKEYFSGCESAVFFFMVSGSIALVVAQT
jgi:hypothetical protein